MKEDIEVLLFGGPYDKKGARITEQEHRRGIAFFNEGDELLVYARDKQNLWRWVDHNALPDVPATTGRIVWYMPTEKDAELIPGIDFGADYRTNYLPAMVVRAYKDGTVNLKAFGHNGIDIFVEDVPFSNTGKFRTWRWPIKSEQEQLREFIGTFM